jgi:predicted phage-related endonuclease
MKWLEDRIVLDSERCKKPKKITGTRFGAVLGKNRWVSPFEAWCAVTRTYEKPYEDNIYTLAGKAIEPIQAEYVKKYYGMNLISPTDKYGVDYFRKTRGDFFPNESIFGGMWDYLSVNEDGKIDAVLEMKTTKRVDDWENNVPEYYSLQASLYAWLLGLKDVIMVVSFLDEEDYKKPEAFTPTAENTNVIQFNIYDFFPEFDTLVSVATDWYNEHVLQGSTSPTYDEKKDKDILSELRKLSVDVPIDMEEVFKEAAEIKRELAEYKDKEKRLKELTELIKRHAMTQFEDGYKSVNMQSGTHTWTVTRSEMTTVDKKALEEDGLLDKYSKTNTTYKITVKTEDL